jgi:hypothetical protein
VRAGSGEGWSGGWDEHACAWCVRGFAECWRGPGEGTGEWGGLPFLLLHTSSLEEGHLFGAHLPACVSEHDREQYREPQRVHVYGPSKPQTAQKGRAGAAGLPAAAAT